MIISTGEINFALFRPAAQSSTYMEFEASKAVDGDVATYSGTYTGDAHGDYRHWWKVQLANPIWVTRVEIINVRYKG